MHVGLCICASLPVLPTRTRVVLVTHRVEDRKSTNTGRIATACLPSSRVMVRGHEGAPVPSVLRDDGTEPVLLFPYEDSRPLEPRPASAPPVTLVVPDGTWRQAFKVRSRMPELAHVQVRSLPPGPPSRYRLRTGSHPNAVSTLEAVARALGILEGQDVQRALEGVLEALVGRTLWVKGEVDDADVPGGLPAGARRHDPRSGLDRSAARSAPGALLVPDGADR